MKIRLFFFTCILPALVFAQQKPVEGIVFDKESKDRIAKVHVLNATTGKSVYNTFKGEFSIDAQPGDILIFTKGDHNADTLKVQGNTSMAVYMKRSAIQLKEVVIRDTMLNPEKQLAATKRDYTKIYGSEYNQSFLSAAPGGGAGISIDAIWNAFSRSGRNADRLREIIDKDYKQKVIDYRFNRTFVATVTQLKDQQLTEFMFRYRPGYFTVKTASDYEFITMIRNNLKRYLRSNKTSYTLAPLITPPVEN
ncbi:hypothetical protein SAMN05216464_109117 [Mucilaginibacter pineti]|uniref:CarboxypepD_reg-like domain-containing protein n=1 Tax=Mucilaginibacter pineti TaxID=1391627 RepID=A0A1G7FLT7_9SPHI|nr:hypothetical protein [Mucilaginibacter pineti]SDE76843.1 hypothetical protein SAMN05216464_109117 [Mucilaginibacter pineti]